MVGLTAGGDLFGSAAVGDGAYALSASVPAFADSVDKELDRFFKAKEHVFKRNWEKARRGFELYLKDFPKGRLRDEGLYWLASSLNMLSKNRKGKEIIALKEAAMERLIELIDLFPKSLWRDDGMALRIEIASQLILMGQNEYTPIIDEAVQTQNKDALRLRILALNSLAGLDESYVRPLIENILKTDPDTEIRKNCVKILAQHFSDSSFGLLKELAAGDADREVEKEAKDWIDRISRSRIPVYMKYNVFGSRFLDESLYGKFPEGQVQTIILSDEGPVASRTLTNLVSPVFDGKLSAMSSSADGVIPYPGLFLQSSMTKTSNRAGDYMLWIKPDEFDVTEDRISGVVEFMHRQTKTKTNVPFQLNKGEIKLLTTRSGNTISILVIQFESERKSPRTIKADQIRLPEDLGELMMTDKGAGKGDRSPYKIVFSDMMGWTVNTARENWTIEDLLGKSGQYDFGQAEAISIDPKGWTLTGNLILVKEEKLWNGRQAVLTDPSGKTVAEGEQIDVPVDNPEKFQIKKAGGAISPETESPDYGLFKANASFQIKSGVRVETDREYFETDEFSKNLISFGRSRASLSEDIPSVTQIVSRKWTLLGDIFWIKDKSQLLGVGALLIGPDRQIKVKGLISVPLDDPASYHLLQGEIRDRGRILEQRDEQYTRTYYPAEINGIQGWRILTTLKSGPARVGGGVDYSLSRATRLVEGKEWVLIGHIQHFPEKKTFLARRAALISSDGKILFGSEIEVPTDAPSRAKVILK